MTRDFNKPRRDDTRPSSRHTPSDNYREERQFKPGRPRLSRDTVDRAWENGGNRNHADYHPRQNTSRPPFQQQRSGPAGRPPFQQQRPGPAAGRPQTPYGRPDHGVRQENYRGPSSTSHAPYQRREQGPDSGRRPFNGDGYRGSSPTSNSGYQRRDQGPGYRGPASNSGYQRRDQEHTGERRPFNETEYRRFSAPPNPGYQRPESSERRFNEPEQHARDDQPGFQSERWTRDQRGPAQPYQGGERRYQDTRPPRFQQNGPARNTYRPEGGPREFGRGDRGHEQFARGNRPGGPPSQRDSYNPRWQTRPSAQRNYRATQRNDAEAEREQPYGRPGSERFEGDYERFNASQTEQEEKHVTRLPDGRVLKGSRPSQRNQARFWNDVAEETSSLMSHTPMDSETAEQVEKPAAAEEIHIEKPVRPRKLPTAKPKAVRTVKTTFDRGTGGMKSLHGSKAKALKRKTSGPQEPSTRPSRRGYKWPAPGE